MFRRAGVALAVPLLLAQPAAYAAEQTVELSSPGRYVTHPLRPDTREVELVRRTGGSCRLGRTWGYELGGRELWANGCSGTFKVITHSQAGTGAPDSSNTAAAIAAAAAIAGIAVLASRGRKHDDNNAQSYYPLQNNAGCSPPSAGYYPPTAGHYPSGGGRSGTIHGPGGMCLDMAGDRVNQGTQAIIYRCHGNNNQRFQWTLRGELVVANMCLDIAGGSNANGVKVIAWTCNGGRNQQWFVNGSQVQSQQNGRCLDVTGGNTAAGTPVIMWDCHGGANQRWFW